jgi:hypothetical protein
MKNDPTIPVVYVTKYALTRGILRFKDVRHCISTSEGMISAGRAGFFHGEGKDWHRDLEGAQGRARKMRDKAVGNLKKKITALGEMSFDEVTDA